MPGRKVVLANGQIYHIVNRGVASQPVYLIKKDYHRALNTLFYYQNQSPPLKYSLFIIQSRKRREEFLKDLARRKDFLVEVIAYCLMPNHFHLLLRQKINQGISKFLSNFTNSYTRYFNVKQKRNGPLFQGKFKAIRIETDEQFLHVVRYIHLNPFSSYVVKSLDDLSNYPYSSFPEYLGKTKTKFCSKEEVFTYFKSIEEYQKFVFDQADYQKSLERIEHLILEE